MVKFVEYDVGTTPGTVFQAPQNYSVHLTHLYVGNTGTAEDELVLLAQAYNSTGAITGTQTIGKISKSSGTDSLLVVDSVVEIVPAGSYLLAQSTTGKLRMTFSKKYVYYRE